MHCKLPSDSNAYSTHQNILFFPKCEGQKKASTDTGCMDTNGEFGVLPVNLYPAFLSLSLSLSLCLSQFRYPGYFPLKQTNASQTRGVHTSVGLTTVIIHSRVYSYSLFLYLDFFSCFLWILFSNISLGVGKRTMECEECTNQGYSSLFSSLDTRYLHPKQVIFGSLNFCLIGGHDK